MQRFRKDIKAGTLKPMFAHSGNEAVDLLEHDAPEPDTLVLSDINMPGMDGFDLLKTVKAKYPFLKVFMVSAYGDENYMSRAKQFGADDFITKPVNFDMLRQKMFHAL